MTDNNNSITFTRRTLLRRTAILGGSTALLQFPVASSVYARSSFENGPVVETSEGRVRGLVDDDVYVFRGLRYGASTAGAGRFLPPRKPPSWSGIWEAFQFGPMAPQFNPDQPRPTDKFYPIQTPNIPESEDCLRLNVYTTQLQPQAKLPVMVWLHGGGFSTGAASMPIFHGEGLAHNGAVVVTINHRLNVFGYTWLGDLLGDEFATSANAGLQDIVQALTWVQENIAGFGGDPGNVTIFGESGGGAKVSCVMAMPAASGLFHRAIIESGPGLTMGTQEHAAKATSALLDAAGLKPAQARDLQKLDINQLLRAYYTANRSLGGGPGSGGFQPVIGDSALPRHPFSPDATPLSADIPLLIGTNLHEAAFFTRNQPAQADMDEAALKQRLTAAYPALNTDEAIATYRKDFPGASPWQISLLVASDFFMRQNSIVLAERKSKQPAPVYMYRFDWETPALGGHRGAMHTVELPFVFNNLDKNRWLVGKSRGDQRLADIMSNTWVTFARSGNPDTARTPHWPAYSADSRATMIFNLKPKVVNDPAADVRRLIGKAMNFS